MQALRAISHTQYVLINRLAPPIGAFAILILIGRHSDQLLGEYALVMTFYYIMQMLPLLGLTPYLMREVARRPEYAGKYFTSIGFLSMLGCIAVDLLCYGFLHIVDYAPEIRHVIGVTGVLIFPGILVFIAEIIFMSLHRAKPVGQVAVIENITRVLLSVTALALDGGLAGLIWVFFATRLGACLAYVVIMKRSGVVERFEPPDTELLRQTISVLPIFLVSTLLFVVLSRMDFLVLSIYEQVKVIGYYAIGYRLFEISIIVLTALIMALFPWISRKFVGAKLHFRVAIKSIVLSFAVGLGFACFAGILFSEYYVYILFTKQYPYPVLLTQLFMAALFISGMDFVAGGLLNAADQQEPDMRAMAVGGTVNVALLFMLIPSYGIYGAFLSKVVGTAVQGVIRFRLIEKWIGPLWHVSDLLRLFAVIATLSALTLIFIDAGIVAKGFMVLLTGFVILPLLMLGLGLFRPFRLLRFYWRPRGASDVEGMTNLIDVIVADLRRHTRFKRQQCSSTSCQRYGLDRGLSAVLFYRLARFFHLAHRDGLARIITQANRKLTNVHVESNFQVGPGWVLHNPQRVSIVGTAGRNLTCIGHVMIGATTTIAKGVVLEDNITIESGAVVQDGVNIPSGAVITSAGVSIPH